MTVYAADDNTAKFCPDCRHHRGGECLLWLNDYNKRPVTALQARSSSAWCGDSGRRWEQKMETDVAIAALFAIGNRNDD